MKFEVGDKVKLLVEGCEVNGRLMEKGSTGIILKFDKTYSEICGRRVKSTDYPDEVFVRMTSCKDYTRPILHTETKYLSLVERNIPKTEEELLRELKHIETDMELVKSKLKQLESNGEEKKGVRELKHIEADIELVKSKLKQLKDGTSKKGV